MITSITCSAYLRAYSIYIIEISFETTVVYQLETTLGMYTIAGELGY